MHDKNRKKRIICYSILTFAVMCFIFAMSAQNGDMSSHMSNSFLGSLFGSVLESLLPVLTDKGSAYDIRKYAHMFEFACLGLSSCLLAYELLAERRRRLLYTALGSFAFSFLYACSDEWHQTFVPERAGRFSDVLIDSVGVFIGVGLTVLIKALRAQNMVGE